MAPLADQERRDFLEICEERYDLCPASTISSGRRQLFLLSSDNYS
jgi:hypothetical protein